MPPAQAKDFLDRALALSPDNSRLHVKLGNIALDGFDFGLGIPSFRRAVELDPENSDARIKLAHCLNMEGAHQEALDSLDHDFVTGPDRERAIALERLGRDEEAEAEYRAVLDGRPGDGPSCRRYHKLLRRLGRDTEMLDHCEQLYERGVRHCQLLYNWGAALAQASKLERARALLLDVDRVARLKLPVPDGFSDIDAFNGALADEILSNSNRLTSFPEAEQANRGSSRVHALFAGNNPGLIQLLIDSIQKLIDDYSPPAYPFDPWSDARPKSATFTAWGLMQRGGAYEEWHLHPAGWLSGVYYIRIPSGVSAKGAGGGCIEFGPPERIQAAMPGLAPIWRHAPKEGHLLLAPSHYLHRTIPSGLDEDRISFAFDVVPDGQPLH